MRQDEIRYCPNCGTEARDRFRFCSHCGKQLRESRAPRQRRPPEPETEEKNQLRLFGQTIGVISALVVSGSVLLPWAKLNFIGADIMTLTGNDFLMGVIVLLAGVLLTLLMIIPEPTVHAITGLLAAVLLLMMILFITDPLIFQPEGSQLEREFARSALNIAPGPYVAAGGCIGVAFGSLLAAIDG